MSTSLNLPCARTILSEIDDIRSGHWDDEIKAKVTGIPTRPIEPQTEVTVCVISSTFMCYYVHIHLSSFRCRRLYQMKFMKGRISAV